MTIPEIWQLLLGVALGVIGLVFLVRITSRIKKFRPCQVDTRYLNLKEAPSLTVCIPVRNEKHAIHDCLERVLASNYPKMEVIVLDDESVDQTPEIVKIFAKDGVRFIKGTPLPDGWIGKNKAMDQLALSANGKYILFLSADTDVKPDSISRLVSFAIKRQAEMVSVAPIREDGWRLNAVFSSFRLFWTLLFDTKQAPAYMTSAWLINRKALEQAGGFAKYKSTIDPERELARYFAEREAYQFLISNHELGITHEKRWSSQMETNVRILCPTNQKNFYVPLVSLILILLSWTVLLGMCCTSQWSGWGWFLLGANVWVATSFMICNCRSRNYTGWLTFVAWPVQVIQEFSSLIISCVRHRLNRLVWKGRFLTGRID